MESIAPLEREAREDARRRRARPAAAPAGRRASPGRRRTSPRAESLLQRALALLPGEPETPPGAGGAARAGRGPGRGRSGCWRKAGRPDPGPGRGGRVADADGSAGGGRAAGSGRSATGPRSSTAGPLRLAPDVAEARRRRGGLRRGAGGLSRCTAKRLDAWRGRGRLTAASSRGADAQLGRAAGRRAAGARTGAWRATVEAMLLDRGAPGRGGDRWSGCCSAPRTWARPGPWRWRTRAAVERDRREARADLAAARGAATWSYDPDGAPRWPGRPSTVRGSAAPGHPRALDLLERWHGGRGATGRRCARS